MKGFSHYFSEDSHSFKDWVDPWSGLPPDVRKTVNRLTTAILRAIPSSPKQKALISQRNALLKKYGVWKGATGMNEAVTRHSPGTTRKSTEQERLASKLTAFMETVAARATRLRHAPATTAWVLAERPKVTSSGYGGQGKNPYHAFVPDTTDSEYMYHFKGHYWWSANNGGWWIESSTRIHIRDARDEWERLAGGAVATGEWRDGSVTLIHPK